MTNEETRGSREPALKVSRRRFLEFLLISGPVLAARCAPVPAEKKSTPKPESKITQLTSQLEAFFEEKKLNLTITGVNEQVASPIQSEGSPAIFSLPVGGSKQESPYKLGFFKTAEFAMPTMLVALDNHNTGRKEVWDILLYDHDWKNNRLNAELLDSFEFVKIGGFDRGKLEKTLDQNKDFLIEIDNRLALFCLNGPATAMANPE